MKKDLLLNLAKLRQSKVYDGYNPISNYANGGYECDYVSPYSKSAHNINAEVMVILQDWSSDENLQGDACEELNRLGYTPSVRTNINLKNLLEKHLKLDLKDTYATNLFPYIKKGGMSAHISPKDMKKAAVEFTLPMLKIIKPKIAIALGMQTFNSLRQSINLNKVYNMTEAVSSSFMYENTRIYFQAHPSQQSQNKRGNLNIVNDWNEMAMYLNNN